MIQFNYEKIMQPNTVIHCSTEQQAINLLKWGDSKGLKWYAGNSYLEYTEWDKYEERTCYYLYGESYESLKYFKENNYTILSYEEVLLNSNKRGDDVMKTEDLKTGMIIELRNGDIGMILETELGKLVQFENGWDNIEIWDNDLLVNDDSDFDIVKIREIKCGHQIIIGNMKESPIIWERKKLKKYRIKTLKEILEIEEVEKYVIDKIRFKNKTTSWCFNMNKYINKIVEFKDLQTEIIDNIKHYKIFGYYFCESWLEEIVDEI